MDRIVDLANNAFFTSYHGVRMSTAACLGITLDADETCAICLEAFTSSQLLAEFHCCSIVLHASCVNETLTSNSDLRKRCFHCRCERWEGTAFHEIFCAVVDANTMYAAFCDGRQIVRDRTIDVDAWKVVTPDQEEEEEDSEEEMTAEEVKELEVWMEDLGLSTAAY